MKTTSEIMAELAAMTDGQLLVCHNYATLSKRFVNVQGETEVIRTDLLFSVIALEWRARFLSINKKKIFPDEPEKFAQTIVFQGD